MVQEYGRYFGMPTCCLRGGCLTGPNHSGVELHGFLSYLVKCNLEGREYKVFGYKGKQVRDNIHSEDVARFMYEFFGRRRARARSTISAAARPIPARFSKRSRWPRRSPASSMRWSLRRREPHRRPHLLLQRPAQDEGALPGLGHHARPLERIFEEIAAELVRNAWPRRGPQLECGFSSQASADSWAARWREWLLERATEGVEIFGIDNLMRPGSETNRGASAEAGRSS